MDVVTHACAVTCWMLCPHDCKLWSQPKRRVDACTTDARMLTEFWAWVLSQPTSWVAAINVEIPEHNSVKCCVRPAAPRGCMRA
eukprot:364418-Chlamydomonas_euryale.AAC.4